MNDWPPHWIQVVEEAFGKGTRIVFPRFFESKKNQVTLLTLDRGIESFEVMAKHFVWGDCEREFEVLKQAHAAGVRVPRPLFRRGNVCFLEYVRGQNLRRLAEQAPHLLDGALLGRWLAGFHAKMRIPHEEAVLRGDCCLPNFVLTDDGDLCGMDFEESGPGDPVLDVAQAAVSLLISTPGEPNLAAVSAFAEAYREEASGDWDRESLDERMHADLEVRSRCIPSRAQEFRAYAALHWK